MLLFSVALMANLSKPILVKFDYSVQAELSHLVRAILFYPERNWKWELRLKNFEVVHGLSRIVRLLPDKIATALAIRREGHRDEDGTFLIKLVEDLAKTFNERNQEAQAAQDAEVPDELQSFRVLIGAAEVDAEVSGDDLSILLLDYTQKLGTLQTLLRDSPEEDFVHQSQDLIYLSDDILLACHVFLDLIHPVWIDINRSGIINNQRIEEQKAACISKLEALNGKLATEYSRMITDDGQDK